MMRSGQEGLRAPSWPGRVDRATAIVLTGPPSPARIDVSRRLQDGGHRVILVEHLGDVVGLVEGGRSVVVVFVGSSSLDALELCAKLRMARCPVLLVYTEATADAVVMALDAGADDVMMAPVPPAELLARIGVAIRFRNALAALAANDVLELPGLRIDLVAQRAELGDTAIDIPAHEFQLLAILARHAGTVLPTAYLIEQIWPGGAGAPRLRVCATRLRKRLSRHPDAPVILTERGVGYALVLRPVAS
jgi:DNA-binding response OmpR family regulator